MSKTISEEQVFISYAREDRNAAERLYNDLRQAGLKPWLDIVDIHPGQNWAETIRGAIGNSRFFIALLSSNSVEKRGFVQSELNEAIRILKEFPSSDIFILPARLDDCKIYGYIKDSLCRFIP